MRRKGSGQGARDDDERDDAMARDQLRGRAALEAKMETRVAKVTWEADGAHVHQGGVDCRLTDAGGRFVGSCEPIEDQADGAAPCVTIAYAKELELADAGRWSAGLRAVLGACCNKEPSEYETDLLLGRCVETLEEGGHDTRPLLGRAIAANERFDAPSEARNARKSLAIMALDALRVDLRDVARAVMELTSARAVAMGHGDLGFEVATTAGSVGLHASWHKAEPGPKVAPRWDGAEVTLWRANEGDVVVGVTIDGDERRLGGQPVAYKRTIPVPSPDGEAFLLLDPEELADSLSDAITTAVIGATVPSSELLDNNRTSEDMRLILGARDALRAESRGALRKLEDERMHGVLEAERQATGVTEQGVTLAEGELAEELVERIAGDGPLTCRLLPLNLMDIEVKSWAYLGWLTDVSCGTAHVVAARDVRGDLVVDLESESGDRTSMAARAGSGDFFSLQPLNPAYDQEAAESRGPGIGKPTQEGVVATLLLEGGPYSQLTVGENPSLRETSEHLGVSWRPMVGAPGVEARLDEER